MVECRKVLAEYQGKPASANSIEIADQASTQLEVMCLVCQSACLPVHSSICLLAATSVLVMAMHVFMSTSNHIVCIVVMECTHLFLVVAVTILHDGCAHVHVYLYLYCVSLCFCVVSRAYTAIPSDSNERPLWWLCL